MTVKKITLIQENEDGSTIEIQKAIRPLKFRQLDDTLEIVMKLVGLVRDDEALQEIFGQIWGESRKQANAEAAFLSIEDLEKMSDEELEELEKKEKAEEKKKNAEFMQAIFKSADTLLTHVPKQTIELLAVISNIDYELLMDQEIEDVGFDLLNAILEVNNFVKLKERGKLFSSKIKETFTFANKPPIVQ